MSSQTCPSHEPAGRSGAEGDRGGTSSRAGGLAPAAHADAPTSHAEVFRRAAWLVLAVGAGAAVLSVLAAALAGGAACASALWGAGAGVLLTGVTGVSLLVPWDRFPLLASSGVLISFAAKIAVMVAVILLAGPHKESLVPAWFLGPFAVTLIMVTAVEIGVLARSRALTVTPGAVPPGPQAHTE